MNDKFGTAGLEDRVAGGLFRAFAGIREAVDEPLWEHMNDVQKYLEASYFLSINPLPQLRHILPQFIWKFARCESLEQARKAVTQSDLIWRANRFVSDWSEWSEEEPADLVTATCTQPLGARRKIFLVGEGKPRDRAQELEFVKVCGGEPLKG